MMPARGSRWREGESSPDTGNLSARPAGKPGSLFAKERLRRSLLRHCVVPTTAKHTARAVCVFEAMAESIWSDVVSKSKPNPGAGPGRFPPVGPEPR
jgi:hypothetical protein